VTKAVSVCLCVCVVLSHGQHFDVWMLFAVFISFAVYFLVYLANLGPSLQNRFTTHWAQLCNFHMRQSHIKWFPDYPTLPFPISCRVKNVKRITRRPKENRQKCAKIATSYIRVPKRGQVAGGEVCWGKEEMCSITLNLLNAKSTVSTFI